MSEMMKVSIIIVASLAVLVWTVAIDPGLQALEALRAAMHR